MPLPAPESEVSHQDVERNNLAHAPCVNPLIVCNFAALVARQRRATLHLSLPARSVRQTNSWLPTKARYFHRRCPLLVCASGVPTRCTGMRPQANDPLRKNEDSSKRLL